MLPKGNLGMVVPFLAVFVKKYMRVVIEPQQWVTIRLPDQPAENHCISIRDPQTLCHYLQYLTCQLPHCICVCTHGRPVMYNQTVTDDSEAATYGSLLFKAKAKATLLLPIKEIINKNNNNKSLWLFYGKRGGKIRYWVKTKKNKKWLFLVIFQNIFPLNL